MPDPSQPVAPDANVSNTPPPPISQQPSAQTTAQQQPSPSTQPPAQTVQTAQPGPLQSQPQQAPTQPRQAMVSNTPPAAPPPPAVQRAGVLRSVAETLAGGPRYKTTIDPTTGATTQTRVPMTRGDIGMAIVAEVLSGAMSGLGVANGPGNVGRAAAAGFQQAQQQRLQADEQQRQQAQEDVRQKTSTLAAQAAAFSQNAKVVLNTAQAERYGVESLKDAAAANKQLLSDYNDAGSVLESNVAQDDIIAKMKDGTYDPTKQIAIPDGFTDLNGKYEQTFSIVNNPRAKVPVTAAQAQAYGDAGIKGWTLYKGGTNKFPDGFAVPGTTVADANQQLQAINLMKQDVGGVIDALSNSDDKNNRELAQSIPNIQTLLNDPNNGPTFQRSLLQLQKYVSHSNMHGMDFYESLQQMASPSKPDPQNPKQFIPNKDAPAANIIAGAIGNGDPQKGWQILQSYHAEVTPESIKNVAQAENILSSSNSSPKELTQAHKFLALDKQQRAGVAGAEAHARANATGSGTLNIASLNPQEYGAIVDGIGTNTLDASQMLRYGKADQLKILADVREKYPSFNATQYQANLGLQKWATSGKGGDQIQALNTLHDHAQDFQDNISQLGNLDGSFLNTPINKLKAMTGNPNIISMIGRMLAVRTEYMNVLNNNHALSVEDKADAQKLLNENQSPQQWLSAINQITGTADLRGAETNARYKSTFGRDMPNYRAPKSLGGQPQHVVPAGATPGRDVNGAIIGYRLPNGQVVRF